MPNVDQLHGGGDLASCWVDIDIISYRRHTKEGKPDALLVEYRYARNVYREWICCEHEGNPRKYALEWWQAHSADPLPNSVGEALALISGLRKPSSVRVKPDGKWHRIQSHRFAGESPPHMIMPDPVLTWAIVDTVSYQSIRPKKRAEKPVLFVKYKSGIDAYFDCVCLEGNLDNREDASNWWKKHSDAPLPSTVSEAMSLTDTFRKPISIQISESPAGCFVQNHHFQ